MVARENSGWGGDWAIGAAFGILAGMNTVRRSWILPRRTSPRDSYAWFLSGVLIFTAGLLVYLGHRGRENWALFSALPAGLSTGVPQVGQVWSLEGEVVRDPPSSRPAQEATMLADLERSFGIANLLSVDAVWKHSTGSGKHRRTYTDHIMAFRIPFQVREPGGRLWQVRGAPRLISEHYRELPNGGGLQKINGRGTRVEFTYFNPAHLWMLGVVHAVGNGGATLGAGPSVPLLASEIPLGTLRQGSLLIVGLVVLAILYFVITFVVPVAAPLRQRFEEKPTFFVFDVTGGVEAVAITLIVGWFAAYVAWRWGFPPVHDYQSDRLLALWAIGLILLGHLGRGVEFFYVANKRDGFLYEVSRGVFFQEVKKVVPLAQLHLRLHTSRHKKSITYRVKAQVPTGEIDLSEGTSDHEVTQTIIRQFEAFQNAPLPEGGNAGERMI